DLKKFYPSESRQTEKQIFIFVGRLSRTHYFKGVESLLRAFGQLRAQKSNCAAELWIVGDGEQRSHYEHVSEKMKISKYVTFFGAVSDEELPNLYRQATTIVLPSTDTSETFGLVLLEAMASGASVIASRLPGVDALVPDGVVGVLVEPGNEGELFSALESVVVQRERWNEYGIAAIERAQQFGDWTSIAQQIASLL
ncbi:MAG: glycosyltransferase family 4 protein, partial [Candidatus Magasanikbacteria bacterium]|nr:glycosyltransferase family 4 protein [Candidatus Magasanikbacteria bacterium]